MKNRKQRLLLNQCDRKLKPFNDLSSNMLPPIGWIKTIRTALGMSLRQLGARLDKTAQSVQDYEKREAKGTITLQTLQEIADNLDLQLVYALVPKNGSLETFVLKQAHKKASEIVSRTNTTMKLEDQGNSNSRLQQAVDEKVHELMHEMPKFLWD